MPQQEQIKTNGNHHDTSDCPFAPGEVAPHSGLYEICHADEDRATVVFRKDEIFPACLRCGHDVRYKLLHAAPHISEDPDFSHPHGGPEIPPQEANSPELQFPRQLGAAFGFRFLHAPVEA